jgi:carbonic anhydrase
MQDPDPLTRREFTQAAAGTVVGLAGAALLAAEASAQPILRPTPDQALAQLVAGNERFMRGMPEHPGRTPADFVPLAEGQSPLAVIIACADSRVAPEVVFDQGLGDLFVVRIAGNVISGAGASVKGSIEYAVAELGVPLVMVMGHSQCGAVKAAIKHIDAHDFLPGSIGDLVETIKPAVSLAANKPGDLLENAIRTNVERGVARLSSLEPILADNIRKGKLKIVGATYNLKTGKVEMVG